jgi:hypothetical protein
MTDLKRGDLVKWRGVLGIILNSHRFSSRNEESWYEILLNDGQVIRTPIIFLEKL